MTIYAKDVPPIITGVGGQAWLLDLEAAERRFGNKPHGTVRSWIVRAPWAHPFWHSYAIHCMHLRPVPDLPPPQILLHGATHEVMVIALNPDHEPMLDETTPYLTPINFAGQFIEPNDEAAAARVEKAVREICDGKLSPDTDFIRQWMHRFSDSNIKGDKSRAGETRIIIGDPDGEHREMVIPPKPGPQDLH